MIHRRKRPNPRSQTEIDLRAGRRTIHTAPDRIAMSDAVRLRENYNPFRPGTEDAEIYDRVFSQTSKDLEECAIKALLKAVPGLRRGSHILSASPTESLPTKHI